MSPKPQHEAITNELQKAVRHTLVYGFGGIVVKALGFLMLPFYTHYLTPTDYGTLEILDLSMSLLGMLLNLGMTAALLRQYSVATSEEEKKATVSTTLLFVFVTGTFTFLLAAAMARPFATLVLGPNISSTYIVLSLASLILGCIGNPCRAYLRALGASGGFVLVDSAGVGIMLVLNIIFIAILKMGLLGILLSSVLVAGVQAAGLVTWTVRRVGIHYSTILLRRMVSFGLPLIFSNLAIFALNFSDRFFLQHLQSLEIVGIYAVGYKFAFMLNYLLVQPFSAMWEPQRYVVHTQANHRAVFDQMFVLYALALTYVALALSVLSPELVHIMAGPKFASSQEVIPIIALAYVFWGLGYYAQNGMLLMNKPKMIGLISIAAVVLNLGLNFILISRYGLMGAAWATLLSFVAIAGASYWCSERVLPLGMGVDRVAKLIVTGVAIYGLARCFHPETLVTAILLKCGLLAIFPVAVWKANILSPAERETLSDTKDKLQLHIMRWKATILQSRGFGSLSA